jgi:hypothetical protein
VVAFAFLALLAIPFHVVMLLLLSRAIMTEKPDGDQAAKARAIG